MAAWSLPQQFARRMLPAAVAAGITLGLVPPLFYLAERGLEEQARQHARHFAAAVQATAFEQPLLWRYDLKKVLRATASHRDELDIGSVEVRDCADRVIFNSRALQIGTGRRGGTSAEAAVVVHGQTIATVRVVMDPIRSRRAAVKIGLVSLGLGLGLALFLLLYPTRVVRGQARLLGQTFDRLTQAEQQLLAANQDLERQVAAAVAEVRELSGRVIEVQEEERARIARDLHDGVGQALTALQIGLQLVTRHPAQADHHLHQARLLAEEALAETRRAVADLRPGELDRLGLEGSLRTLAEGFELRTGVATAFRISEELGQIPSEVARALFRILQEALTNVSRHAQASEVGIVLRRDGETIRLQVEDDGAGFDASQGPSGSGLRGMEERARYLGGQLRVTTAPQQGTRIEVELPLHLHVV